MSNGEEEPKWNIIVNYTVFSKSFIHYNDTDITLTVIPVGNMPGHVSNRHV